MQRTDGVSGEGKTYYLHTDHLGSVVSVTDAGGTLTPKPIATDPTVSQRYYAYGKTRIGGNLPTDYTFTGQKQDSTGLMYFNARYFDPQIGAFISPDALVADPTNLYDYNRYMAFRGNPVKYTDPTGHCIFGGLDTVMCVSALTGAVANAAGNLTSQVLKQYDLNKSVSDNVRDLKVDWGDVAIAAGSGAVAGFFAPVTGGLSAVAANSVANFGQYVVTEKYHNSDKSLTDIVVSKEGAINAAGSVGLAVFGTLIQGAMPSTSVWKTSNGEAFPIPSGREAVATGGKVFGSNVDKWLFNEKLWYFFGARYLSGAAIGNLPLPTTSCSSIQDCLDKALHGNNDQPLPENQETN